MALTYVAETLLAVDIVTTVRTASYHGKLVIDSRQRVRDPAGMIVAGIYIINGLYVMLEQRGCFISITGLNVEYAVWIERLHNLEFVVISRGTVSYYVSTLSQRPATINSTKPLSFR